MTKITIERATVEQALKALEVATTPLAKDRQEVLRAQAAIKEALAEPAQDMLLSAGSALRQALEQPRPASEEDMKIYKAIADNYHTSKQPAQPAKLKVTLKDRPIDIELAQYKRMFEAACSALGQISDALGCDPEEGGAEPILAAIAELNAEQPAYQEPVGYFSVNDYGHWEENDGDYGEPFYDRPQVIDKSAAVRIATALGWEPKKEWVGLTLEDKKRILYNDFGGNRLDCMDEAEKILKEKNT